MRKQAKRFGAEIHVSMITNIDTSSYPYEVTLADESTFKTRSFIVASGAAPRKLGIPGETLLWGNGVSSCATCDGAFYPDKHVIVIGGGDSAMEEATFLTKFAKTVTVIHRRDELRASQIMQDRAMKNDKIEWKWSHEVLEIHGDKENGPRAVTLVNNKTEETYEFACDGVFYAIGHIPNTQIFDGQLDIDDEGYITTAPDSTKTNIPGIFAVGDVQDKVFRQAITAAGTGCMGALEAEHYLAALGEDDAEAAAE